MAEELARLGHLGASRVASVVVGEGVFGKPLGDHLRDVLASPTGGKFDHYLKVSGSSGAGAEGGDRVPEYRPMTPEERAYAEWQAGEAKMAGQGYGSKGLTRRP